MLYWLSGRIGFLDFPAMIGGITTRSIFAVVTAFLITLAVGRPLILLLFRLGVRSVERTYGDINTEGKAGTPIMGGLLLLAGGIGSALLWCDLGNRYVWTLFAAAGWFAAMGALDDLLKVRRRDSDKGLSRAGKYLGQIGFALGLAAVLLNPAWTPWPAVDTRLFVPFYKHPLLDLGWVYIAFIVLMIVYSANAVNFADGLDGLAVGPSLFVLIVLGVFAYVLGNAIFSRYLLFTFQPGAGEIAVFLGAVAGAAMGFLWFNCHPAEVFMGDTGSLYLGGVMGTAAILLRQEFVFLIAGGVFVAEIASTALQEWVGLGLLKRRILYRAPIHHTFQHSGMAEPKIVSRFWIVSALLAALALATLKVR
jgi:phospho-N-acetylmuramoyl-pentapeptide-transferase